MNDLDSVLRISEESLGKLVKAAQADLFFEIMRAIKEIEKSEEHDPTPISQLIELRFKNRF
jgi:hypothetical protein